MAKNEKLFSSALRSPDGIISLVLTALCGCIALFLLLAFIAL